MTAVDWDLLRRLVALLVAAAFVIRVFLLCVRERDDDTVIYRVGPGVPKPQVDPAPTDKLFISGTGLYLPDTREALLRPVTDGSYWANVPPRSPKPAGSPR